MRHLSRRAFGRLALGTALAGIASPAIGQARPRVVVIGGGAGGATAAKYLARTAPTIEVTLVEPNASYETCFFGNLCLAGLREFGSLEYGYDALGSRGVTVVLDAAAGIDPAAKQVRLAGGDTLAYDRLIVAPGIDFRYEAIEGYSEAAAEAMPHAWRGSAQARLLKAQLEAMPDGGLFVLVSPPDPYRCPPGPYERVSLVADYFKRAKPKAKILVLDGKNTFSKQDLFLDAWSRHYSGMIEWLPLDFTGGVKAVNAADLSIVTDGETFRPAVANVIPPQSAGRIALDSGLANEKGWCPVDPATLQSTLQLGIHLVGDAIVPGDMPKSAFAANSQAKACAMAVAAALTDSPAVEPLFFNTCWSFLAPDDAVRIGASYRVAEGKISAVQKFISKVGESTEERARTARQADAWYAAITTDMFS